MVRADYLKANPTATPSAFDWYYIERLILAQENFALIALVLAFSFIGLYIGSMLKKTSKDLKHTGARAATQLVISQSQIISP